MTAKSPTLQEQLEKERKLVSFDSYDLTVRQLLDMVEERAIFVPPEYQRQFIWKAQNQSTLVESILLGIPIPSIFMATKGLLTNKLVRSTCTNAVIPVPVKRVTFDADCG